MSELRGKLSFMNLVESFAGNEIVIDGQVVKCNACDSVIKVDEKHQKTVLQQLIQSLKHKAAIERTEEENMVENADSMSNLLSLFEQEAASEGDVSATIKKLHDWVLSSSADELNKYITGEALETFIRMTWFVLLIYSPLLTGTGSRSI
uniref:Uncharacterized protein n=1 Tax=Romanomermis culicivorax TaxID=13658 RepID=A0A915K226_ROMCU